MSRQTAGSALVDALERAGTERVWGLIGNHVLEIYDHLGETSIEHVQGSHEEGVVRAAGGAARTAGQPEVVVVSAGPGATNTMTGIGEASAASIPMVVVAGNEPSRDGWHGVEDPMAIPSLFGSIAKDHRYVRHPTGVPDAVAWAFERAVAGRPGPVVIQVPKDVLTTEADFDDSVTNRRTTARGHVDEETLQAVVDHLDAAERPVVLAGQGACRARIADELDAVAARLNAPVAVTRRGLGAYVDAPRYAGAYSLQTTHRPACSVVESADVVLGIGVRERERRFLADDFDGSLVYVLEGHERHALSAASAVAFGDLESASTTLKSALDPESRPDDWWLDALDIGWQGEAEAFVAEQTAKYEPPDRLPGGGPTAEQFLPDDVDPVHPATIVSSLNGLKSTESVVTTDVGVHNEYAMQYLELSDPYTFLSPDNWGAMGHGVPAAIGAKVASPDRDVVAIVGDGSFLMTLSSFLTAVTNGLDITVLVCNNHQHNAITALQDRDYGRSGFDHIAGLDYAAFAEECGGEGFTVDSPDVLDEKLERALACEKPTIVDVLTEPNVEL